MSDCRRTTEQLATFADGLLPGGERAAVERHLDACAPCRRLAAEVDGGRIVLRERGPRLATAPLPPGLRSRCEALVREAVPARSGSWRRRLVPSAAIVAMLIATVVVIVALTARSNVVLAQQLTADHMKCFLLFATPASAPIDARDAEQTLARTYGWDVRIPPSSKDLGVTLIGARRCLYASGTIPHVMYRVGQQNLSLFVLDNTSRTRADVDTFGHRASIWSRGSKTFVLVSERGAATSDAAQYFMEHVH
jgi:anti-sigma factor RsiW